MLENVFITLRLKIKTTNEKAQKNSRPCVCSLEGPLPEKKQQENTICDKSNKMLISTICKELTP